MNLETNHYGSENVKKHETRGLDKIDVFWDALNLGSFDAQLSQQLLIAKAQGRDEVTFLDLGSGNSATLLRQIINDKGDRESSRLSSTRKELAQHPDMHIRIVGLTDALSDETFLKSTPLIPSTSFGLPHPTDHQIKGENIEYTITHVQSLERFLKEIDLPRIDLVASTMLLPYLDLHIFEEVITTLFSALSPDGGKMVGIGYPNGRLATTQIDRALEEKYGYDFLVSPEGKKLRKDFLSEMMLTDLNLGEKNDRKAILDNASDNNAIDLVTYEINFVATKR